MASTVERLVQAFEDAAWQMEIDSPFGGVDANYIHQAVLTANDGLDFVRFHVRRAGRKIAWLRKEG